MRREKDRFSYMEEHVHQLGDALELLSALEYEGFSPEEIKTLGKSNRLLSEVRDVLRGQAEIVKVKKSGQKGRKKEFLKLISDQDLIIFSTYNRSLWEECFAFDFDPAFKNCNKDEWGLKTEETRVGVYEVAEDATFAQMFQFLSSDVSRLCLIQAQINLFAFRYDHLLRTEGGETFFLFRLQGQPSVASLSEFFDKFYLEVCEFKDSKIWHAKDRHRLVVPCQQG